MAEDAKEVEVAESKEVGSKVERFTRRLDYTIPDAC